MTAGAVLTHTRPSILSGPRGALMRLGGEATPFFISDTQTGSPHPRTQANQSPALLCINTFHPQSAREAGAGDLVTVSWTI